MLTYRVVGRELEEVGGQDGWSEEPQEDEAAHGRVPHVQVICGQDTETADSPGLLEPQGITGGQEGTGNHWDKARLWPPGGAGAQLTQGRVQTGAGGPVRRAAPMLVPDPAHWLRGQNPRYRALNVRSPPGGLRPVRGVGVPTA